MQDKKPNIDIVLQYGDCILLESKGGFLSSQGFTKPSLFIQVGSEDMICHRNFRDFVFQIMPRMRYEAFKEYSQFKVKYEKNQALLALRNNESKDHSHVADELRMVQLTKKLEEEVKENKQILARRIGEQVHYGNEVELIHFDSKNMVEASKTVADYDKQSNLLQLTDRGSKAVSYIIEPRYKYRSLGQKVTYGDVLAFRNIKTDLFMHISDREVIMCDQEQNGNGQYPPILPGTMDKRAPPNQYAPCYEVNCSSSKSKFSLRPYRNFCDQLEDSVVKGGQVVRLQHSETGAYLASDDKDFSDDGLAEVFLWNYKGKSSDIESTTTNMLFELEIVEDDIDKNLGQFAQYSGNISNPVTCRTGGMHFRLRHLNTGRLVVYQEFEHLGQKLCTVGLTNHYPNTVQIQRLNGSKDKITFDIQAEQRTEVQELQNNSIFRLVSTGVDIDNRIRAATSVQLQHIETKDFLILHQNQTHTFGITQSESPKEKDKKAQEENKSQNANLNVKQIRQNHIQRQRTFKESQKSQRKTISRENSEEYTEQIVANLQPQENQQVSSLYSQMDETLIFLGTREILTFEKNPNFENAFFIFPEDNSNLKNVLYVHTSVNLLSSFLPEISSKDFGVSKEQVKKIERVIREMTEWLQIEKDLIQVDEEQMLGLPYSLEANEIVIGRERRKKEKQKIMRELRVIESCVQILYVPFANGAFEFKKITQECAITSICMLIYNLMKNIFEDYPLNELYASQWIKLYLQQILETNSQNQIGADAFVTTLVDQNKNILESQFDQKTIQDFIHQIERTTERPRLLKLLTALCSVQGEPIISNQTEIIRTILQDEKVKNNLLIMFRKQKRTDFEICLSHATQAYQDLQSFIKNINKIRTIEIEGLENNPEFKLKKSDDLAYADYLSFLQILDLFAEACLGRNIQNQEAVEEIYNQKITFQLIESSQFPFELRSRLIRFYLRVFLDRDKFQPLTVPSETMIWNQLTKLDQIGNMLLQQIENNSLSYPIKTQKAHISRAFIALKDFSLEFLKSTKGVMKLEQREKNEMTYQVLVVIHFMVNHGFYRDQSELNMVAKYIIEILNGSNDSQKISGKDVMLGIKRYFPSSQNDFVLKGKILACKILIQISRLETDQKCSIFLSKIKSDIESGTQRQQQTMGSAEKLGSEFSGTSKDGQNEFNQQLLMSLSQAKGFEKVSENQYICILFDLMLYKYAELKKAVFELLIGYFLRRKTVMMALQNIQVLESSKSIHTLNDIKEMQQSLRLRQAETAFWLTKNNQYGDDNKQMVIKIFKNCENYCVQGNETLNVEEQLKEQEENKDSKSELFILYDMEEVLPNKENQRLMRDFKIAEFASFFIKQRVDRITNSNSRYIQVIQSCYRFLISYVRENFANQVQIYEDLDYFMRDTDKYQIATLLVYEIFRNNKKFLMLNVTKFLRSIVSSAEEMPLDSHKKANYLKLLDVFSVYQGKLISQNQSEIIQQFTYDTARSNVLYLLQPEGAKELYKPLDQCLKVHYTSNKDAKNKKILKLQSTVNIEQFTAQQQSSERKVGRHMLNIQIFNVIQLLTQVSLCCQGKNEISEKLSQDYILSFLVSGRIIVKCGHFWPLKIAILEYINQCFMDSQDTGFLQPNEEDEASGDEGNEEDRGENDIVTLLKIVEDLNSDFEAYLNDEIVNHELILPTGKKQMMYDLAEEYIFDKGLPFMKWTIMKKPSDIGSFDMKFFDIGKNLASLFYKVQNTKRKLQIFHLLSYIHTNPNSARYLSDCKHPAKKLRNNEEYEKLLQLNREENEAAGNVRRISSSIAGGVVGGDQESSKSSLISNTIVQITSSEDVQTRKEQEFEEMVSWVVQAESKIGDLMDSKSGGNQFTNVSFSRIITALLELLDAQILSKDLQLTGIKLIRKIVEVENAELVTPAADWDSEDWIQCKRIIVLKQDLLTERGCIPFLCKLISETEDAQIREEAVLVCITLLLGGNLNSQNTFIYYMVNEDPQNKLLLTIKDMLQNSFEQTKKYLTEKNAKLEMIHKIRKQKERKKERLEKAGVSLISQHHHGARGKDSLMGKEHMADTKNNQGNYKESKLGLDMGDQGAAGAMEDSENDLLTIEDDNENEDEDRTDKQPQKERSKEEQTPQNFEEETKNLQNLNRILRLLQQLCEGHHKELQNHLREQLTPHGVKNPYSFDFVAYCSILLGLYVKTYVNCYSIVLGNQLIESLVEMVQGPCRQNQKTLVDTKVIDCCRDLLSQGSISPEDLAIKGFIGKKKSMLDQLKMNAVKLLLSIIEGTVDEGIYQKVSQSLGDFQIVITRMETLYEEFVTETLRLPANSPLEKVQNTLKSDSIEGQITEGFDIYDLLNQLADVIQRDKEKLQNFEHNQAYSFFKRNTGKIEVNVDGDIQIVFFIIQPICWNLTPDTKHNFLMNVERETQQDKILGLLASIPSFIDEMEHLDAMKYQIVKLPPKVVNNIRDFSTFLSIAIAFVIIFQYKYTKVLRDDGAYDYRPYITPQYETIMKVFGYMQLVSSSFLLIGFFINQRNLVIKEGWRNRIEKNQMELVGDLRQVQRIRDTAFSNLKLEDMDISQARQFFMIEGPYSNLFFKEGKFNFYHPALIFEYYWVSLSHLISSGSLTFAIQYLAFSVQGLVQSPVFYAFHLLDMIERFPTLKDVIRSVTMNIKGLLMTAMLGLILIYLYGVLAFLFIPDLYFDESIHMGLISKAGDSICMSLLHCFLSTFNYGLRTGGGIGEFLPAETAAEYNSLAYDIRFFFDVSFFLLVITILLNVIFGIIIDTFAELREKSSLQAEDMKNRCYICGLARQKLDRDTEAGFEHHVANDHETWNYVFFMIHLQVKDKSDMNGVESYIKDKFEAMETSWFPLHRCLAIIKEQRKNSSMQNESDEMQEFQKQMSAKVQRTEENIKTLEQLFA